MLGVKMCRDISNGIRLVNVRVTAIFNILYQTWLLVKIADILTSSHNRRYSVYETSEFYNSDINDEIAHKLL